VASGTRGEVRVVVIGPVPVERLREVLERIP